VASAFASSATQHGGNETTLITAFPLFMHHGMFYVETLNQKQIRSCCAAAGSSRAAAGGRAA
jgi:multimeric flavodoxin WrbA